MSGLNRLPYDANDLPTSGPLVDGDIVVHRFLPVQAAERLTPEQVRDYLAQPGVHMLMRHAYAPGTGDPEHLDIQDCSTQRNLNDQGRSQAMSLGKELHRFGIHFHKIYTSQWCRCKETARLLKHDVPLEELTDLNSIWNLDREHVEGQTRRLREFIASRPPGVPLLFVTHQANILALTEVGVASGQSVLIEYTDGRLQVLGIY
ncbi:MAG: histidine phosphatase family protein [Candidatus Omnitrophica bacterium]|nr:histidine phosphatase family protein [Candidatus Omnitrophota bacterium]MCB9720006.1 histidine phosphatase family protein [Candidatus Omnitrophota bacterium]